MQEIEVAVEESTILQEEAVLGPDDIATFTISDWNFFSRFLMMGPQQGQEQLFQNPEGFLATPMGIAILACLKKDSARFLRAVMSCSIEGRSLKNDYPLFAYAVLLAYSESAESKFEARKNVTKIARTGTDILHLAQFVNSLKGWGSGTRKMFIEWYNSKKPEQLAYQLMKYAQRDGWSHRDVLRKAHPVGTPEQNYIFNYVTKSGSKKDHPLNLKDLPEVMQAALEVKAAPGVTKAVDLIAKYGLPWEVVPDEYRNNLEIWKALYPAMGLTAKIRQLGKLSELGLLNTGSRERNLFLESVLDYETLKKGRIHPMALLTALKVYSSGKGVKGSLSWKVDPEISTALENALELSFGYIPSTGRNFGIGVDISGSMMMSHCAGTQVFPLEAAAILCMVTAKKEKNSEIVLFTSNPMVYNLDPSKKYREVLNELMGRSMGTTDCSLPIQRALNTNREVDLFAIYTDNETNTGRSPHAVLKEYREKISPRAKLVVAALRGHNFSIAKPDDPLMLDIPGFDANVGQIISNFAMM